MVPRGNKRCPQYCYACGLDCKCEFCQRCHSCDWTNKRTHHWRHTCVPEPIKVDNSVLKVSRETFARYFETDIISIKIGDKTYHVHEGALSSVSNVFKRQISSTMKEGLTKTIELEDTTDNGLVFSLFVGFCYSGSYTYDGIGEDSELAVHASVYTLAEKIEALELKALALKSATALCANASNCDDGNSACEFLVKAVLPKAVHTIYEGTYDMNTGKLPTADADPLPIHRDGFRLLLADFAASHLQQIRQKEAFMSVLETVPDFAPDVLLFALSSPGIKTDEEGNHVF